MNQITKVKKKISNLRKLLIGLFTILSIGFGAAMHMISDVEQVLIDAEAIIASDTYMGAEVDK